MDWVTALKVNIFVWAKLKLTLLYLLIIAVIITAFSILFYYTILDSIQTNLARTFMDKFFQEIIIHDISGRTRHLIIIGDMLILVIAVTLSYFLAGRTLRPIQTAMQLQQQFTADASHELRTPLTILKTDMEVALRQPDFQPAAMRQLLQSDLEEVNRLARLAEQLLTLFKHGDTTVVEPAAAVDVRDVANRIVQKLQAVAVQKQIILTMAVAETGIVLGHRHELEALLLNLIQNALDYTPAHGTIQICVTSQSTTLQLIVRDSGSGIAPEDLPHLFQRFYKTDKTRNHTIGGAGLGLAIVHAIVRQHHGDITIDSAPDKGTTVTVTLPRYILKKMLGQMLL